MIGKHLRTLYRLPLVGGFVYSTVATGAMASIIRDPLKRRRLRVKMLGPHCRGMLKALRTKVSVEGLENKDDRPHLIIANHMSYLDVLVISSVFPAVFVTSQEILDDPILGTIVKSSGNTGVERRDRSRIRDDLRMIQGFLEDGFNVVVFPEGTTSKGEGLLPFKRTLLKAAIDSGTPIRPLVIEYTSVQNPQERDAVCYYGEVSFFSHILRATKLKRIQARLKILPSIETHKDDHSREVVDKAFKMISEAYSPYSFGN